MERLHLQQENHDHSHKLWHLRVLESEASALVEEVGKGLAKERIIVLFCRIVLDHVLKQLVHKSEGTRVLGQLARDTQIKVKLEVFLRQKKNFVVGF